ncbi:efflux RND transporter periplasmic adaptor subunit [Spirosoma sordidisoli]|uniref:Efflux RND transporter periplasmic adaptor subunit n=1 Tax=Spirosoma sordidisoli TaxID=2502893 RepID=A0A4V1RVR4_9BACT|nr:efflux RND transporter periplasmic adaptor subunit [Spirosoma sordidisoli]RYC67678.1 efflux RND transporter periplasmic adaptor subunit [Spirosoma sordidisoli]
MKLVKVLIPLALLIAVFVFFGVLPRIRNAQELKAEASAERNREPVVNAVPLKQASDTSSLTLPGQIQPFRQTPLFARTQGFLRRWYVDIGAQVKQGQLLATIDVPELEQDIARAQADQQLAQANLDRLKSVQLPGAISKQDIDTRQSGVAVAQANLRRLQALKALQQIHAPFSGVITSRNAEVGNLVSPGSGQPLFTLSELGSLRVFVDVPQTYYQYMKVGTPATVVVPELKNRRLVGKVVRTSGTLRNESRTLLTEVLIPNPGNEIPSGLYSSVHFDLIAANAPVLIPANALQMTPQGPRVVIVGTDQRVKFVPITLGRDYGTTIEVTDGLTGQERVVTNPNDRLRDGQRVRLRKPIAEKTVAQR